MYTTLEIKFRFSFIIRGKKKKIISLSKLIRNGKKSLLFHPNVSIDHLIARKQCRNCNILRPSDLHLSCKCVYLSEIAIRGAS